MIYLDHAATTPADPRVIDAMMPFMTYEYGNPGSLHECGRIAKIAIDHARKQVAGFLSCEPEQIIFTSGGTEGNNTVFRGLETELRRRNRTAVTISAAEHDSVWKSAHKLCMQDGFRLYVCSPSADGDITPQSAAEKMYESTGLVSVMTANNETGVINDIKAIGDFCRERGILFHTDAVQAAGIVPLDTSGYYASVDFMTISSHKIGGPKGMGALFARDPSILSPLICGGDDQEFGFRGGTENVAGIIGLGKACEICSAEYAQHLAYLTAQHSQLLYMLKSFAAKKGIDMRVNGDITKVVPKTLNVCFPGIDAETLVLAADLKHICISAGSACRAHENVPSRVLTSMGLTDEDARCSIRISLSHLNTPAELELAAEDIIYCAAEIKNAFGTLV